jgi:methylase of polypeptide subunit release factors
MIVSAESCEIDVEHPHSGCSTSISQQSDRKGDRFKHFRSRVELAITVLGEGFLRHPDNQVLRGKLQSGGLTELDYYHQLQRLVYCLLFLLILEDREALLDPAISEAVKDVYHQRYSVSRLRERVVCRMDELPSLNNQTSIDGASNCDAKEPFFATVCLLRSKLGSTGDVDLGLPILGGFLWSDGAIADLDTCKINDSDFLDAIEALVLSSDRQEYIDYQQFPSKLLGSIYESLLALRPEIDLDTGYFELKPFASNRRKSTGCYYTPEPLVICLLDSALEPVLQQALQQTDPEAALLNLNICDTACGSGHFLTAAAHRVAQKLAKVRTGAVDSTADEVRAALRQVISRCIYGVDVNPMAVELCKMALWMESMEPGKPLLFLEHHIQVGNALLGVTLDLMVQGIPDQAFSPIANDDRLLCRQYRQRNRQERSDRNQTQVNFWQPLAAIATQLNAIEHMPEEAIAQTNLKREAYQTLLNSSDYRNQKFIADAWCAAFVGEKTGCLEPAITDQVFWNIQQYSDDVLPQIHQAVEHLTQQHQFFHWQIVFAPIFDTSQPDHCSGGFDVILGNPPFVNAVEMGIMARSHRLIKFLHPLVEGSADLAFYFFERDLQLLHPHGKLGLIQPRPLLNSPAGESLRTSLREGFSPNLIYAPDKSRFFPAALIFACLIVIGIDKTCRVSRDPDPTSATWKEGIINYPNWWFALEEIRTGLVLRSHLSDVPMSQRFEVFGSMTTGEAYELQPFILDAVSLSDLDLSDLEPRSGLKLVTTGLIDPQRCFWGDRTCRYLGKDYQCPIVSLDLTMPQSLQRRLLKAHRPKIIVAGLTRKLECFLDAKGEFMGAKSTFTILHPDDEVAALEQLCDYLLSETAEHFFRAELGANAVGGGDIVMKKAFLQSLRIPTLFAAEA